MLPRNAHAKSCALEHPKSRAARLRVEIIVERIGPQNYIRRTERLRRTQGRDGVFFRPRLEGRPRESRDLTLWSEVDGGPEQLAESGSVSNKTGDTGNVGREARPAVNFPERVSEQRA